tara:strand:- start:361 stop:987 length:627 start_codon:yes stop_codon:yes gene_type:complete
VNEVLNLLKQGKSNEEITNSLEQQGFNLQQVSDAINQANIKMGVESNMPPSGMKESSMTQDIPIPETQPQQQSAANLYPESNPQAQGYALPPQQTNVQDIHVLVEEVVEEKWRDFIKSVGNVAVWKARMGDDLEATKQELLRTQKRIEELQTAVLGKVKDYNKNVVDINREMKALEQVFGKILEPLTDNIKELKKVTEEIKHSSKHHR